MFFSNNLFDIFKVFCSINVYFKEANMQSDEDKKRAALQKLFQDRMSEFSLETPENYVSKLVKREVIESPPKKKKINNQKQLDNALKKIQKQCFIPSVEINENDLEYSGSKYFGKTWLSNNEGWPQDSYGNDLVFVLQLDIKTLPDYYKNLLGKTGLFQLFVNCTDGDETYMRIVHPDKNGKYHEQPVNDDDTYLIEEKKPQQKMIQSWTCAIDYPHPEEQLDDTLADLWEEIQNKDLNYELNTYSGDKLGGYAFYAQAGGSSEGLLFQLNAHNELLAPAHAPILLASDGTELVFYDKKNKSFYFDWACG